MFKKAKDILFSLRPSRHIHYTVLFIIGYLAYNGFSFENKWRFIQGIAVINLLFASALLVNSIYDAEIDGINRKPNMVNIIKSHEKNWFTLYGFLLFILFGISLLNGITQFIVCLILSLMSYFYSAPPLRLKKIFILNLLIIAVAATGTVFLAYIWTEPEKAFPTFNFKAAVMMTILLAAAFSVKDVNDYEGDLKGGIITIMTLFGERKGRYITAILAAAAYFLTPFAINKFNLTPYSFAAGILTFLAVIFGKKVNETFVFIVLYVFLGIYLFFNPIQPEMQYRP